MALELTAVIHLAATECMDRTRVASVPESAETTHVVSTECCVATSMESAKRGMTTTKSASTMESSTTTVESTTTATTESARICRHWQCETNQRYGKYSY